MIQKKNQQVIHAFKKNINKYPDDKYLPSTKLGALINVSCINFKIFEVKSSLLDIRKRWCMNEGCKSKLIFFSFYFYGYGWIVKS